MLAPYYIYVPGYDIVEKTLFTQMVDPLESKTGHFYNGGFRRGQNLLKNQLLRIQTYYTSMDAEFYAD